MKATAAVLTITLVIVGFGLVTNAIAQTEDAGVVAVDAGPVDQPKAELPDNEIGVLGELVKSVKAGEWRYAAALALTMLMLLLNRFRDKLKWFKGDRGGAVLVAVLALAGAVATALASDATLDWRLFLGAAGVMWTAVGGYTWVKRLIWPTKDE